MAARTRAQALHGAACLKLQLERKGVGSAGSEIYRGILEDLGVSDSEVDDYIEQNRDRIEAALDGSPPLH